MHRFSQLANRRRVLFAGGSTLALASCGGLPSIPISVQLPPEVTQLVSDATAMIGKLDSIRSSLSAAATALIDKGKAIIASFSGGTADGIKSGAGILVSIVQELLPLVPNTDTAPAGSTSTFSKIVSAVTTVLRIVAQVAGVVLPLLRTAPGRMANMMTVDEARQVLNSR